MVYLDTILQQNKSLGSNRNWVSSKMQTPKKVTFSTKTKDELMGVVAPLPIFFEI